MVLEEVEEETAWAEAEVFEEIGNGAGSDHEDQAGLRKLAYVPTAEQLYLISRVFLVFGQNVPIAAHL